MNLAHWLARTAAACPDRPALFLGRDCIAGYAAFFERSMRVAGWLRAQGVQPGERVGIAMKNTPDYLVLLYGILAAGAVVVPVNAKLHAREISWILEHAGAKVVFTSPGQAADHEGGSVRVIPVPGPAFSEIGDHPPAQEITDRAPDDLAWLFYTSGTTGRPKGVMITFRMLTSMSLCYVTDVDTVSASDATLYAAPMSHGAGLYNFMHVQAGAAHVCPVSGGFDPAEIFELAQDFGNIHMFAAPTMVHRLTRSARAAGRDGTGFRTIIYAGGPMYNADIIEAVDTFGSVFAQIYGQGECPMGITSLRRHDVADRSHPHWQDRLGSVGRAQSAVEVAIGDRSGRRLAAGETGEVMVRGDTVMPGYWNDPKATSETLADGWLMTGDTGFLDEAGYLTLRDRSKDLIITGGSNVYPREVEEVLLKDPDVDEISVVGRPHPEWGEEVVAFFVGDADPDRLDRLCLDHLARFKRPKAYFRLPELPKNNYGKVLKTDLRVRLKAL